MSNSAVVHRLLTERAKLPPTWRDEETGQPSAGALEELTWALIQHSLDRLLYNDPLPRRVRVGREQVAFSVDEPTWDAFAAELGLASSEVRREITDALSRVLRREPLDWEARPAQVPPLTAGLVYLLDGFSQHARGGRRATPRQGTLGFDGGDPDRGEALAAVTALIAWAGASGATPESRYRVAFHVVWRPLSRRSLRDVVAPSPVAPTEISLPLDFLLRARTSHEAPSPIAPSGPTVPEAPTRLRVPTVTAPLRQRPAEGDDSAALLLELLEPFLSLRGDPQRSIEEAETASSGLTADLLRAWRRVLLSSDLELFGQPGAVLSLDLPDSAWKVADGPFLPRDAGRGPTRVRVVRRGALLGGDVLVPGVVVYESSRG